MLVRRRSLPTRTIPPGAKEFRQTLAESDQARDYDDDRDNEVLGTGTVGLGGGRDAIGEEHAETDIEIPDHTAVTRQGIRQEDITKFPMLRVGETAHDDPFQGQEEANAAGSGGPVQRPDQDKEEDDKDRLRDVVEAFNEFGGAAGGHPKGEEPNGQGNGEDGG